MEQKNIPVLRFPEFEGEWKKSNLGLLANIWSGLSLDQNNEGLGYPVTRIETISDGSINFQKVGYVDTEKNIANYKLVKGDILFSNINSVSQIGKTAYVSTNMDLYHGMNLLLIRQKNGLIPFYLFLILNIQSTKNHFKAICNRAVNQASINQTELSKTKIFLPTLPEQQKIASFFTAIDQKISQLKRKHQLLEQYKKGVMQKIFSQQIRFKDDDGREFPKWEKKRLGELSIKVNDRNKNGKVIEVFTNSASSGIVTQRDYFDKDIANQDNLFNYIIVEKDDFIYNPRISNLAPVGPVKRNKIGKGVMSPLYSVFRFKYGNLDFLEFFFETTQWHKYMEGIANYGARADRMNITTGDFYIMPVPFPCLKEQTKIANFLSAIDDKIQHTQKQIEQADEWKKGLMQKMFV